MIYDYIIIGGGVAGLTVAAELAKRKHTTLVLEYWPMWGGRVSTERTTVGSRKIQYEIGAGRIYSKHERVAALVKKYGLRTYPISTESEYEGKPNHFIELFAPLKAALEALPASVLATHTIRDLVPSSLHHILAMFPYTSEFSVMRADVALSLFSRGRPMSAKGAAEYYGLVEGIDSLAAGLHRDAVAAGAHCRASHKVDDAIRAEDGLFDVTGTEGKKGKKGKKGEKTPFHFRSTNVIVATCRCSLAGFSVLKGAPLIKQVQTGALMRIYAVYPPGSDGRVWFAGLKKQVTAGPLRHVIPINESTGLIMISYTDGDDTKFWREKEGRVLEDALHKEAVALFPGRVIPRPLYLKKHDWTQGCSYWTPVSSMGAYDIKAASRAAHNPAPHVYVVGESVSTQQTWIEGALESAELLLRMIK
jgi:hypothetical protein